MTSSVSFQPPRRLRVFAFDPATGNRHANRRIRELTLSLPWELDPVPHGDPFFGPDGAYLQVVDYDPASGVFYEPINLNAPEVLYNDGLRPSEENPKFHQQMVYAVAMETISVFEQALGRVVLWAPRLVKQNNRHLEEYVGQLRIYPHALREANAFYDPAKKALLFGYFTAGRASKSAPPGTTVFTCLSHDIIVHETCHAILDGMHPRFVENSNPDMLALHEAFADIVAIFQHFSHPQVLQDQIARTRGDLEKQSLLGALAQEFGQALGSSGALRDALGRFENGTWVPREPDNTVLERLSGPHARGAILVAAVFRAFLSIYNARVADLMRIASNGSGILREGELDPDLVKRLASEAAKSARHILRMCIRAMDYVPPVDVSFGDFLRAIVTADHDLFPEDDHGYRLAVIEAFTAWGILPEGLPVITERALLWPELRDAAADLGQEIENLEADFSSLISRPDQIFEEMRRKLEPMDNAGGIVIGNLEAIKDQIIARLEANLQENVSRKSTRRAQISVSKQDIFHKNLLSTEFEHGREVAFQARKFYSQLFWGVLSGLDNIDLMKTLGIAIGPPAPRSIKRSATTALPSFEVHTVRMANRVGKRGQGEREYVVEVIQSRDGFFDPEVQKLADAGKAAEAERLWLASNRNREFNPDFRYRSGCTLMIDATSFAIRRVIRTRHRADEDAGLDRMRRHLLGAAQHGRNAFDDPTAPRHDCNAFAALHRHVEREEF